MVSKQLISHYRRMNCLQIWQKMTGSYSSCNQKGSTERANTPFCLDRELKSPARPALKASIFLQNWSCFAETQAYPGSFFVNQIRILHGVALQRFCATKLIRFFRYWLQCRKDWALYECVAFLKNCLDCSREVSFLAVVLFIPWSKPPDLSKNLHKHFQLCRGYLKL